MRFLRMVHEEIRGRSALIIRWASATRSTRIIPTGWASPRRSTVANMLEREGLVDFFNCIFGRFDTRLNLLVYNIPDMTAASAPWLRQVGAFKAETDLPVFHAAKIADVATARFAVDAGLVDMVGMTRAHMADPQIVNKLRGRQGGADPPLRRRLALSLPAGALHPQSGDGPRDLAAAGDRALAAGRAQGRGRRWRPGGAGGGAGAGRARVIGSCCSRRRIVWVASCVLAAPGPVCAAT
jgi:hypothetical protein